VSIFIRATPKGQTSRDVNLECYDEKDSNVRFEAALRGALKTPHRPLKEKPPTKKSKAKKRVSHEADRG
jgi:hypothetical protein